MTGDNLSFQRFFQSIFAYFFIVSMTVKRKCFFLVLLIFALRRRHTRKRLVMSQRRYEGACNRIADANVTFCEKGGMTEHMTDFSAKKNRNGAKSIPTW